MELSHRDHKKRVVKEGLLVDSEKKSHFIRSRKGVRSLGKFHERSWFQKITLS